MKKYTHSREQWLANKREAKLRQIHWYLQNGWAIFPVNYNKVPLTVNGCHDASTNPEEVRLWWEMYPNANVAIATGRQSGLVVIDVDYKNGKDGLSSLDNTYGDSFDIDYERQLIAKTPSGGCHLYYRWDDAVPVTTAVDVLPGIDIRGEGGYVVAPPSGFKIDGEWETYQWYDVRQPVPVLPDWAWHLLDQCIAPPPPIANLPADIRAPRFDLNQVLTGLPEGRRDDQLFRYACHLRGCGVPHDLALGFMRTAASRCHPPFSEALAIAKVDYAYRNLEQNLSLTNEE